MQQHVQLLVTVLYGTVYFISHIFFFFLDIPLPVHMHHILSKCLCVCPSMRAKFKEPQLDTRILDEAMRCYSRSIKMKFFRE